MSFHPEGKYYRVTTMSGSQFFCQIKECWDHDMVLKMPAGNERILTRQGYQWMDEITKDEWLKVIEQAKTMGKKKADQVPAEMQA